MLCRFPRLSLARAQEPEDPEKAVGTQPGARERAPNEPPHPSQGRSQCILLSLPRPWQRRSPKSLFVPQTQRLRPPAPGIQESVPSPLGSLCPSVLRLLVTFSRTFPASPQGPHLELNKCAFGFFPRSVCVLSSVGTRGLGGSCPVPSSSFSPRASSSHHILPSTPPPRGLPFSAPLSPSASLRASSRGHRPQSPTALPLPSSHSCLWGLETREEMTEPLWSPPACVRAPGHTLRREAAPTRYSDTQTFQSGDLGLGRKSLLCSIAQGHACRWEAAWEEERGRS